MMGKGFDSASRKTLAQVYCPVISKSVCFEYIQLLPVVFSAVHSINADHDIKNLQLYLVSFEGLLKQR